MTNIERPAWLASLPPHWGVERGKTMTTLIHRPVSEGDGIVTAFRDGRVMLRANRRTDGFTEAVQEIGYQGVRSGELVIHSMDGFAGAIGVSESDGKMSPVVHIYQTLRDNPYYIAYALRVAAQSGFIQSLTKGIRERSTSFDKASFRSMLLPRPPRSEQDRIVDYIDREVAQIDELITEQQRLIQLLRERRNAAEELPLEGFAWNTPVHVISSLIQTGPFGSQLKSSAYIEGGVPVINPSHIREGKILPDPSVSVSEWDAERINRHRLRRGDVITVRRGSLGSCAVVREVDEGALCGTGSAIIRPDLARVVPRFLALAFGSMRSKEYLKLQSVGSTMPNLNSRIIGQLKIPVPSLDEQTRIVNKIDYETSQIDTLISESERLIGLSQERRSALITAAVTGQIDIPQEA